MEGGDSSSGRPAAPYSVEMDPDKAREFVQKGATLLLLDVPPGTAVGFDHQVFLSGPKFKGVKMLPPGPHMLSYYAVGSEPASFSAPTIRWLVLSPQQVVVLRWQPSVEMLEELLDEDEVERYALGVRNFDFDGGLAPYYLPAFATWSEMAGAVTQLTLDRLLPRCVNISVTAEAPPPTLKSEERLAEQLKSDPMRAAKAEEGAELSEGPVSISATATEGGCSTMAGPPSAPKHEGQCGRCQYTPLPMRVHTSDLTPAQLTAANMDKSAALADLIATRLGGSGKELLGEFQMAFLNFVMGHSLEGYSQWKDFLLFMCSCSDAASGPLADLVLGFARTLRHQLLATLDSTSANDAQCSGMTQAAPFGVPMVEELLSTSFLKPVLRNWMEDLEALAATTNPELIREARFIRTILARKLGIQLEMSALGEDDEYAPVVVEL